MMAAAPFTSSPESSDHARSRECLTQAIYYEARSQSPDGQRAVAQVVLNRVRHPDYPDTICDVVFQGSWRRTGCQFSFTCDGSMRRRIEPRAWEQAGRIADEALSGGVYRPVGLALNYHTTAIRPYWAPSLVRQAVVGDHIFYRRPGRDGFGQPMDGQGWAAARAVRQTPRLEYADVLAFDLSRERVRIALADAPASGARRSGLRAP